MSVRLRPHHLLCMLTYAGEGYTPAFTAGFNRIVQRIREGDEILVVSGPDDVCAPLLGGPDAHCRRNSVLERDRVSAGALAALLGCPILPGERIAITANHLARMRAAFAAGDSRGACSGCEWEAACTAIAAAGFGRARLG